MTVDCLDQGTSAAVSSGIRLAFSNKTALAMSFKLAAAAEKSWRRLDGHYRTYPWSEVRRRNRDQIESSSRCRLIPPVTNI